jgi:hypothetical protein
VDNLSVFTSKVLKAYEERNTVTALFLDIKSAYDNVCIDILVDRIKEIGMPGNLLAFISNLTSQRELFFRCGELQWSGRSYRGLPHGDVLSLMLYALCTSELKEVINSECRTLEFADHVAIYAVNRHHRMGVACIEVNAEAIQEYIGIRGLKIARNK